MSDPAEPVLTTNDRGPCIGTRHVWTVAPGPCACGRTVIPRWELDLILTEAQSANRPMRAIWPAASA